MKIPTSILDFSKRTTSKILVRLGIGCSRCGWNEAPCDIHHIKPRAEGGNDAHENLSCLCPNCHRLAHNGKVTKFVTLAEQIGDRWREVYDESAVQLWHQRQAETNRRTNNILPFNQKRRDEEADAIQQRLATLKASDIDFSKYGWTMKAAPIVGINSRKVSEWVERNDPELFARCFRRKSREEQQAA